MSEECPNCGRTFSTSRGMRVHHSSVHDEVLPNRECADCGSEFYSEEERRYCSDECRNRSVSFEGENNPNYRGGRTTTECDICGSKFEYYPSEKEGLYCPDCVETESWRHRPDISGEDHPDWNGGKREVECEICGKLVYRHPNRLGDSAVLCSRECHAEWLSEAFTGEGHPDWEGGGLGPYGKGWNALREHVLERDDHTCVRCGITAEQLGRNSDVHHIVPVREFHDAPGATVADAHYPANLVSLCPACHRRAEFGAVSRRELRTGRGSESPAVWDGPFPSDTPRS